MGLCKVGTHWLSINFDTTLQALKLLGRVRRGLLLCEPLKHAQYSGSWTIANTLFCYSVEKVQILQRQIFSIKILYFCYFRVEVFWYVRVTNLNFFVRGFLPCVTKIPFNLMEKYPSFLKGIAKSTYCIGILVPFYVILVTN